MKSTLRYIYYSLFLTSISFAQQMNPAHVINVCSNSSIQGHTPATNQYNNLFTPCSTQPLSNALTIYYVEIESGSTFEFEITPSAAVDFDFASWLNPNFNNLGPGDRGSQNTIVGVTNYSVGTSLLEPTQLCEIAGAAPPNTGVIPGLVRYYNVVPGDGILIAVDHWESSTTSYDLSFGGDAVLNCSVIGKTYEVCDEDGDGQYTFNLNQIKNDINNVNNSFTIDFFEFEGEAYSLTTVSSLPNNYVVTTSQSPKKLYARFKRANGILARVTEVDLIVNEIPKLPNYELFLERCDVSLKQKQDFNLHEIEVIIESLNPNKNISYKYYEDQNDAIADNTNTIQNSYVYYSGPKTLYLQLSIDGKCPIVVPLRLIIDKSKIKPKTIEYSEFCAKVGNNELIYDLTKSYNYFVDDQDLSQFEFSFHKTQNEAYNNSNAITNISEYNVTYNTEETLYLRIANDEDCFMVSELYLNSKERITKTDEYNAVCEPYILQPLPLGYNYFTEPNGGGKKLLTFTNDAIIYGKRTIYIYGNSLFVNSDYPKFNQCSYETSFTVYNNDCLIPKGFSPNYDGLNDSFDLTPFGVIHLKIFNRYGKLVYEHGEGYTNQFIGETASGSVLPSGTYFYSFESINGTKTGWVEMIRETK